MSIIFAIFCNIIVSILFISGAAALSKSVYFAIFLFILGIFYMSQCAFGVAFIVYAKKKRLYMTSK